MAATIDGTIKAHVTAIVLYCDQQIAAAAPNPADPVQIATDKIEQIAYYSLVRTATLDIYAV